MYQYILNLDAVKEAEGRLERMAETFKNAGTPEAQARAKFLYDNLAIVRAAIQAGFHFKSDPKHTVSAIFRHVSQTGAIASVSLFRQAKGTARRMSTPQSGASLSVGPKGMRTRFLSYNTQRIRELSWEDRGFLLRMHNSGTDIRTAHATSHGRGTYSTWGARGAIGTQNAVERASSKMEQVAKKYGEYITIQASEILNK